MKTIIALLSLHSALLAADLSGDSLLLNGEMLIFPANQEAGFAPYGIKSFAGNNPDGTKSLIWNWGINLNSQNGQRYDTNLLGAGWSLETNWHPPGAYAGQVWQELYQTLVSPDGHKAFRSPTTLFRSVPGTNWVSIENGIKGDVFSLSSAPITNNYIANESAVVAYISRGTNAGAVVSVLGFLQTYANALNKGGVNILDGGNLLVFSPNNTNSLGLVLTTSSRSGWSGRPTTRFAINGPSRALEIYGHTNVFFQTEIFEITGTLSPAALRLPTNAAPADASSQKTWIPIQGTNGQTYLVPAYQ